MEHQKLNVQSENVSFERVLNQYKGLLFRICRRFCGRETTVDDLMQEIAIVLWRQREKMWSVPEGLQRTAWVWRVARNAAIDVVRKAPDMDELQPHHVEDLREDDRTMVNYLYEQIEMLPPADRDLVKLQLAGYAYDEIAEMTGLSVKNVSVKLVRIKDKLRKMMTE